MHGLTNQALIDASLILHEMDKGAATFGFAEHCCGIDREAGKVAFRVLARCGAITPPTATADEAFAILLLSRFTPEEATNLLPLLTGPACRAFARGCLSLGEKVGQLNGG